MQLAHPCHLVWGCPCSRSLPLRGRRPSAARSDEVAPAVPSAACRKRSLRCSLRTPAIWCGAAHAAEAFPSGEGGRAQQGRMRSLPLWGAWPGGAAFPCSARNQPFPSRKDCSATASPSGEGGRAQRGRMRSLPLWGRMAWWRGVPMQCAQPAVSVAEGLHRYSLPLRGRRPSAARSDEVAPLRVNEPAVFIAGPGIRTETRAFLFSLICVLLRLGCCDIPAQGASPFDPFPLARSLGVV